MPFRAVRNKLALADQPEDENVARSDSFNSLSIDMDPIVRWSRVAMDVAKLTESPIETLFGVSALRTAEAYQMPLSLSQGTVITLIPQFWWRRFRIDWAFKISGRPQPYFFVECDGQDFHSSVEQQKRDAARDAEVGAAGIPIFRFTGSELNASADACAQVVIHAIRRAR